MPSKGKIFTLCTLANKIPTWDHLQKRQIAGPGWCSLCKDNEENTNHLFLSCIFSKQVWEHSKSLTSSSSNWEGNTVEDACKDWSSSPHCHTDQIPSAHPHLGNMVGQKQGHFPWKSQLSRRSSKEWTGYPILFPPNKEHPQSKNHYSITVG